MAKPRHTSELKLHTLQGALAYVDEIGDDTTDWNSDEMALITLARIVRELLKEMEK